MQPCLNVTCSFLPGALSKVSSCFSAGKNFWISFSEKLKKCSPDTQLLSQASVLLAELPFAVVFSVSPHFPHHSSLLREGSVPCDAGWAPRKDCFLSWPSLLTAGKCYIEKIGKPCKAKSTQQQGVEMGNKVICQEAARGQRCYFLTSSSHTHLSYSSLQTTESVENHPVFHCENKEEKGGLRLRESGVNSGNMRQTARE